MTASRLYLAGPDVFRRNPSAWGDKLKTICTSLGLVGVFPLDAVLEPVANEGLVDFAMRIRESNLALIRDADGVLANVSPFRGPNCDDGTAFECGYATALGKPVFAYSDDSACCLLSRVMFRGDSSFDGVCNRDQEGFAIEEFDLPVNLMLYQTFSGVADSFRQAAWRAALYFEVKNQEAKQ